MAAFKQSDAKHYGGGGRAGSLVREAKRMGKRGEKGKNFLDIGFFIYCWEGRREGAFPD